MTPKEEALVAKIHAVNYGLLDALDRVCQKHGIRYYLFYGGLLGAVRYGDFIPWDDDVDVVMTLEECRKLYAVRQELGEPYMFVWPEDYGDQSYDMVPRINDTSLRIVAEDSPTAKFYKKDYRNYASLDIFLLGGVPDGSHELFHKVRLAFWYGVLDTYRDPNRVGKKGGLMALAQAVLHVVGHFTDAQTVRRHYWREFEKYPPSQTASFAVMNDILPEMKQKFTWDQFEPAAALEMKGHTYTVPCRYREILKICYGENYMTPPPEAERRPESMYR